MPYKYEMIYKIIRSSKYFDCEFYKSQYTLVDWDKIDPVEHYIKYSNYFMTSPSQQFCTCKYLARNPETYGNGYPALFNYLVSNADNIENYDRSYKTNVDKDYISMSIKDDNFINIKFPIKRLAIFVSNTRYNIDDGTICFLENLIEIVDGIIFITNNYLPMYEIMKVRHLLVAYECAYAPGNIFDLYRRGYNIFINNNMQFKIESLLLCNNFIKLDMTGLNEILNDIDLSDFDCMLPNTSETAIANISNNLIYFKNNIFNNDNFNNLFVTDNSNTPSETIFNIQKLKKILENNNRSICTVYSLKKFIINSLSDRIFLNKNIYRLQCSSMYPEPLDFHSGYFFNQNIDYIDTIINNSNIKFSIIMATHNRGNSIENSIDSVLEQSFQNFELIIINDASNDDTEEIIKTNYSQYIESGKIRYYKNEKNVGPALSRNKGFAYSINEWLVYIDDDNTWELNYLENFYDYIIRNPLANLFYCKYTKFPQNEVIGVPYDREVLLQYNYTDGGAIVFNKKLIEIQNVFANLKQWEDYEFILRLSKNEKPVFVPVSLLNYNDANYQRITHQANINLLSKFINNKFRYDIKVTTIITTYNHEDYIAQAINSALMQTGDFSHEIIISDDGSSDRTLEIIEKYKHNYGPLLIDLSSTENLGISGNMRKCINHSSGKYICILEGDDFWADPFKIQKQLDFMESHPNASMCISACYILREEDMRVTASERHVGLPEEFNTELLLSVENPTYTFSAACYRADILKKAPDFLYENRISETSTAFYFANFGNIGFLDEKQVIYRERRNSAWSGLSYEEQLKGFIQTYSAAWKAAKMSFKPRLESIIEDYKLKLSAIQKHQ